MAKITKLNLVKKTMLSDLPDLSLLLCYRAQCPKALVLDYSQQDLAVNNTAAAAKREQLNKQGHVK